ncbi:phosphoribosylanthranilate isomerase [Pusillimonas sp. DMV24BSW_D]|uniref:phosphoribosylanthranilate isomerase n=1 Tax=Neopusillimonas aestuarii TaxID=2716226 RepID=UPI00140C5A6B|nr:phosphoribosylanthranilate isomerase [Pusillimonas sp. DMV24BSW_D]QIM50528.1 phosphoribosylanthranilate isomerase [Pusillimonas sp. DMV24BSW_D]
MRTRVKICGLTRAEDVNAAVAAGADAVGLVFYPPSSRYVLPENASDLRNLVPAMVSVVALFVNASNEDVQQVIDQVQPDVLQFHGDESPDECEQYGRRYMKAFRVGAPGLDTPQAVLDTCLRYRSASAWLFDSYSAGYGGSGKQFDLGLLEMVIASPESKPVVLAGGLNVETVGAAIAQVAPFAVDVSSGVEISGGVKCEGKIRAFMQAVALSR